jgi:hypothetical protein
MKKLLATLAALAMFTGTAHAASLPDFTSTTDAAIVGSSIVVVGTITNTGANASRAIWASVATPLGTQTKPGFVSVATDHGTCAPVYFTSGALNRIKCSGILLSAGETATVTATYFLPSSGWSGHVFTFQTFPNNEYALAEVTKSNNNSSTTVTVP